MISYWQLEVGGNKLVNKEIGFNKKDEPIIFFPNKENEYGFFGDSPTSFEFNDWEEVSELEFMHNWRKLNG